MGNSGYKNCIGFEKLAQYALAQRYNKNIQITLKFRVWPCIILLQYRVQRRAVNKQRLTDVVKQSGVKRDCRLLSAKSLTTRRDKK